MGANVKKADYSFRTLSVQSVLTTMSFFGLGQM